MSLLLLFSIIYILSYYKIFSFYRVWYIHHWKNYYETRARQAVVVCYSMWVMENLRRIHSHVPAYISDLVMCQSRLERYHSNCFQTHAIPLTVVNFQPLLWVSHLIGFLLRWTIESNLRSSESILSEWYPSENSRVPQMPSNVVTLHTLSEWFLWSHCSVTKSFEARARLLAR